jgi:hypothetical protein
MPFQSSIVAQDQPNTNAKDAELEWLLCLASVFETCKRGADSATALPRRRVDQALPRPRIASAKTSNAA